MSAKESNDSNSIYVVRAASLGREQVIENALLEFISYTEELSKDSLWKNWLDFESRNFVFVHQYVSKQARAQGLERINLLASKDKWKELGMSISPNQLPLLITDEKGITAEIYDLSQTRREANGLIWPELPPTREVTSSLDKQQEEFIISVLKRFIEVSKGYRVIDSTDIPTLAMVHHGDKAIYIQPVDTPRYISSLLHEIAHLHGNNDGPEWLIERNAESAAYVAGRLLGVNSLHVSAAYNLSYQNQNYMAGLKDVESVRSTIKDILDGFMHFAPEFINKDQTHEF